MAFNTAADIRLPFKKYSYVSATHSDGTVTWAHDIASDLVVLVNGSVDGRLAMRIVKATTVVESIDIGSYIDSTIAVKQRFERAGAKPLNGQLPIFCATNGARVIAFGWRLSSGEFKRIQLVMQDTAKCRQIVDVLQRRGMEIDDRRPPTGRPNTSATSDSLTENRPLTLSAPSLVWHAGQSLQAPNPFVGSHVLEAGSLSRIPAEVVHSSARLAAESGTPASEMPPPRLLIRNEGAAPKEARPTRPTTAQMYRSRTMPWPSSQAHSTESQTDRYETATKRPLSGFQTGILHAPREMAREYENSPQSSSTREATNPTAHDPYSNATELAFATSLEPTQLNGVYKRPSTIATTPIPHTLEHEIPPRRELPFKHTASDRKSDRTASHPGSSALELPPLPRPNLSRDGSKAVKHTAWPSSRPSTSRPATSSPLKRAFPSENDEQRAQTVVGKDRNKSQAEPVKKKALVKATPAKKIGGMAELLATRKPLSDRSTNKIVSRRTNTGDVPHENMLTNAAQSSDQTLDFTEADRTAHDNADHQLMEVYASRSREDRQAALDDFMVANIENSAFTTLCEDIENSWRRIALGL